MPQAPDWIRVNLSEAQEPSGQVKEAIAVLNPALEQAAGRLTNVHMAMARLLRDHFGMPRAAAFGRSVLHLRSETPSDLQLRGLFYQLCGMPGQSKAAYSKALEIEPSRSGCRVACITLMIRGERLDAAKKLIDGGLEITPGQRNLLTTKADYYLSIGTSQSTEEVLRDLVAQHPQFWQGQMKLINLIHGRGRTQDALVFAEKALALEPPHAPTLEAIARVYLALGRSSEASEVFRRALFRDENLVQAWIGLSRALEAMGKREDAVSALRDLPLRHRSDQLVIARTAEIALNAAKAAE